MTNKKFKIAAMSMALTACVAAQPLIANAADETDTTSSNGAPEQAAENVSPTAETGGTVQSETEQEPVKNDESEDAVSTIGGKDVTVDYEHEKDTVTEGPSGTTTDSTGTVNRDVPKESEPNAQQPAGDGQQGSSEGGNANDGQQTGGTEGGATAPKQDNEQDDGQNDTEKKPIGSANKSETVKKETDLVLGETTTETTTTTNPDGSTTTDTTTTTDATLETTTTVTGEASAKTDETTTENVADSLDNELGGKKGDLSWDTAEGTKFGDYTVSGTKENTDDGSKTFTLTKKDQEETGEMTGEDIAKLIEAGYKDNGNGTYTLTRDYTDSKGQKQTTTITVDSSTATKTTSTTLTVTMEKTPHHDQKDVDESTDTGDSQLGNRYPAQSEIKDKDGNILWTGSVAELLKDSPNGKVTCYEEGGKTYTFTFTESSEGPNRSFNFSAEDAANLLGDGYSCSNGKIYHTDGDKLTEVDYNQAIQKINLHIQLTVSEEKKEDHESVNQKDGQTIDAATAAAEKKAAEDALKDALKKAAGEAGITVSDDELNKALAEGKISTDKEGSWEYKTTVGDVEKTFTFHYDKTTVSTTKAEASDSEKADVKKDNGEKIDDINKNTSTGTAYVKGGSVLWAGSGKISDPADGSPPR